MVARKAKLLMNIGIFHSAPPKGCNTQTAYRYKVSAIRREVRRVFREEEDAWAVCVRSYTMQGNLFALLQAEGVGITWKSYMWNLPCGGLKFALNASIDTLPTFTNLKGGGSVPLSTAITVRLL
jgi:hypothetical protein